MNPIRRHFILAAWLTTVVTFALPAPGSTARMPYGRMAPLDRYLMTDREAEIRLAQSAAPPAIARRATILVLTSRGYETALKGPGGFTCLVERSWMSPFGSAEFWNWRMRGPICYNPAASRTILIYTLRRTDRALSGETKSAMLERIRAAVRAKKLPTPEPGSMSYMLSKRGYLGDGAGAWMPHLMFYGPADAANDGASWGANVPGSPVVFDTSHRIVPEPETVLMVPVGHWSDGTAAPQM